MKWPWSGIVDDITQRRLLNLEEANQRLEENMRKIHESSIESRLGRVISLVVKVSNEHEHRFSQLDTKLGALHAELREVERGLNQKLDGLALMVTDGRDRFASIDAKLDLILKKGT